MSTEVSRSKGPRVNSSIRAPRVKLIDNDGKDLGVVNIQDALRLAKDRGLDLMEVSPNPELPVCKMLDYGKYKYQSSKKEAENRKKQKVISIKEIKLRPVIDSGDYKIKLNKILELLQKNCKVKVSMKFKGREAAFQENGLEVMRRLISDVDGVGKPEKDIESLGSQLFMIIVKA